MNIEMSERKRFFDKVLGVDDQDGPQQCHVENFRKLLYDQNANYILQQILQKGN